MLAVVQLRRRFGKVMMSGSVRVFNFQVVSPRVWFNTGRDAGSVVMIPGSVWKFLRRPVHAITKISRQTKSYVRRSLADVILEAFWMLALRPRRNPTMEACQVSKQEVLSEGISNEPSCRNGQPIRAGAMQPVCSELHGVGGGTRVVDAPTPQSESLYKLVLGN